MQNNSWQNLIIQPQFHVIQKRYTSYIQECVNAADLKNLKLFQNNLI